MRRRRLHCLECLHFLRPTWPGGRLEEKTKRGRKENQGGKLLSRVAKDIVPARLLARAFVCVCVCACVCVCVCNLRHSGSQERGCTDVRSPRAHHFESARRARRSALQSAASGSTCTHTF